MTSLPNKSKTKHGRAGKAKEKEPQVCPICELHIKESTNKCDGDEALFCEGQCQAWVHRQCVGMSKTLYALLARTVDPYVCPNCSMCVYRKEIDSLKTTIASLSTELLSAQEKLAKLQPPVLCDDVASSVMPGALSSSGEVSHSSGTQVYEPVLPRGILPGERRFNVVIHGVKESQENVPRYQRNKCDLDKSLDILTTVNDDINSFSIRDCFRLGRFRKGLTRPRPLMVKLNRAVDVASILSNRSKSPKGVSIKADLNQEERRRDALLLAERWRLMQSGTDKRLIKIKSSVMYVQGKKHCEVVNSCLKHLSSQTPDHSVADQVVETAVEVQSSNDAAPSEESSN